MQERSCVLQAACEKQPVTSEISGESDLEAEERKRGGGRHEKSNKRSKAFLTFFFYFMPMFSSVRSCKTAAIANRLLNMRNTKPTL